MIVGNAGAGTNAAFVRSFLLAAALNACAVAHDVPDTGVDAPASDTPPDARSMVGIDAPWCEPETCDGVDQDCDGRVDEESRCSLPGAAASCVAGDCIFEACAHSRLDCDGDLADGCEIDGAGDRENCGGCGIICGLTETCEVGTCVRERIIDGEAGHTGACVLLESGRVLCWGDNVNGLLIDVSSSLVPIEIEGFPSDGVALRLSSAGGFLVRPTGEVWSWGGNIMGAAARSDAAALVRPGPADLIDFHAVRVLATSRACAVDGTNHLWCFGAPLWPDSPPSPQPIELPGTLRDFCLHMGAAGVAVTDAGTVTWGGDGYGVRGAEPGADIRTPPRPFAPLPPARRVWCNHELYAELEDGTVWSWGRDITGALANGAPDDPSDPSRYAIAHDPAPTYLRPGPAEIVSFGDSYRDTGGCARYEDGELWCWGGPTTTGTGAQSSVPVRLELPFGPVADLFGHTSVCALSVGRTQLYCWGLNDRGELGNGASGPAPTPTPVVGFE